MTLPAQLSVTTLVHETSNMLGYVIPVLLIPSNYETSVVCRNELYVGVVLCLGQS